jgi:GntR family transcriptional regulator
MVLKHETVAHAIRELIASSLSPHEALPSERDLMELHHVSRQTVRAAISRLIDEGLIYSIHGSGTYVGSREIFSKSPKLTSFTEDMTSRGFTASSRVLAAYVSDADDELARRLAIPVGSPCTVLRRLRLADDEPMAIEEAHVPASILDLSQLRLDESLYAQLANDGHEIIRSEQEITATELDDGQCALLQVPKGSAALCVLRVSSSRQGRLIEFARDIYRADRYSFRLAVTKDESKR